MMTGLVADHSTPFTYRFSPVVCCDMCGSRRFRLLGMRLNGRQGMQPKKAAGIAVSVKQCRDCALIFADPQPVPETFADHYGMPPEDYWAASAFQPNDDYFADEIKTAQRLLLFRPGMKALDIGAGLGKAMQALTSAGFDTWGIEPSEPFYRRAIERVEADRLLLSTIEEADFEGEQFDFITFGAVLEHLYNPSAALDKAMKWLKPGGVIQAEVPNSHYLMSKIINSYFRARGTNYVTHISPMHPPFHLYEFSLRSFKKYKVAEQKFAVCTITGLPRTLHPLLRWWMERTNTGMQLTVYLRR
jgi:2-polyprenyl-3-methyl-5-hydroxy-6-metoxy-1,4-benzoquinol methylase